MFALYPVVDDTRINIPFHFAIIVYAADDAFLSQISTPSPLE